MELASMLAGEPFTDQPRCADPVIATFLRAFNDRLDHHRRQRLRPYAAAVVGTRQGRRAMRARRRACLRFAGGGRGRVAVIVGLRAALRLTDGAPELAAREAIRRDPELGFALLDELLGSEAPALPLPVAQGPELRVPSLTA
jgi:hypothetical protein